MITFIDTSVIFSLFSITARDPENHVVVKRRSTENDDPQWNKKKW